MTGGSASGANLRTVNHAFELIAGHPALDLVNTLDWRFREDPPPEELLNGWDDLARFTEKSGLMSNAQSRRLLRSMGESKKPQIVAAVRELREAAAPVLYAALGSDDPPASSIKLLEHYFRKARESQHLLWDGDRLGWELAQSPAPAELPLWMLALSVAELTTSDQMRMLRECGNPECRWLFLDTSKNHTRRWCDMKICGNRMKARRFKAQHRA